MKRKSLPIPAECAGMEIKVQRSNCTGEAVVGFYDPKSKKLKYAEFAANEQEIRQYYQKYGKEDTYGRNH